LWALDGFQEEENLDIRLTPEQVEALRQIDTRALANAIEIFGVRLRKEGFADSSIHCLFGSMPPTVGYAVTARIRCSNPSPTGHTYFERTDWWDHILNTPAPRVFVMQDVDEKKTIAVCRSPEFSAERLRAAIEKYESNSPDPQTSEVGTKSRIEDSRMPRKAQYLALCWLLSLAFSSCSRMARSEPVKERSESDAKAVADKPVMVAVARVERKDLSQGLTLAAEFRPFQEIDLHAKVAGYVREINVDVGDRVKQGKVIATLEIPEFKSELMQAEATKRRSESDVVRARSEMQRAQSVYEAAKLTHSRLSAVGKSRPNLLAQQEIDDALARLQVAEAQLNAAKAAIAVAEEQVRVQEANEARVKTLSSYAIISAPFSGVITKGLADKGALIQQGTASQTQAMPVVRLSQIDHLRLVLPVPESAVPRIRLGRVVKVK